MNAEKQNNMDKKSALSDKGTMDTLRHKIAGILWGSRRFTVALTTIALLFTAGMNSLMAESPAWSQTTLRISEVETPWTNTSGEVVTRNHSQTSVIPQGKTAGLTLSDSEVSNPPIRMTQGTFPTLTPSVQPGKGPEVPKNAPAAALPLTKEASKLPNTVTAPQGKPNTLPNMTPAPASNAAPAQNKRPFLSPDSIIGNSGEKNVDGTPRDKTIILPDGAKIDLKETEDVNIPEIGTPNRSTPGISRPLPKDSGLNTNNKRQNIPNILTSPNSNAEDLGNALAPAVARRKDGRMLGNPYAMPEDASAETRCAMSDYYPGQLAIDPNTNERVRAGVPAEAYGTDGWGNNSCGDCSTFGCGMILENMQFGFGVVGYTSPIDIANQGNFGGDLSLNWSTPKRYLLGLSAQAGARLTITGQGYFSNFIEEQDKNNTQFFWTTGLFYRNPCSPWKAGIVYDSLNGSYYSNYTLGQIRTELSHQFGSKNDIGFRGAFQMHDDLVNWWRPIATPNVNYEANIRGVSYYTAMIRHYFDMGGEGLLYGGVTDENQALVGGQIEVPIGDYVSLKNTFNYVFTKEDGFNGTKERNWNVAISLVVYLGGNSRESLRNPLRPLFDVADNGTFLQTYR